MSNVEILGYEVENIEAVILCSLIAIVLGFATANAGIKDAKQYEEKCYSKYSGLSENELDDKCPNLKTKWYLVKILSILLAFPLSMIIVPIIANR